MNITTKLYEALSLFLHNYNAAGGFLLRVTEDADFIAQVREALAAHESQPTIDERAEFEKWAKTLPVPQQQNILESAARGESVTYAAWQARAALAPADVSQQLTTDAQLATEDSREFGAGIVQSPGARYWQKRSGEWMNRAVALGWREHRDACQEAGIDPDSAPPSGDAPKAVAWDNSDFYGDGSKMPKLHDDPAINAEIVIGALCARLDVARKALAAAAAMQVVQPPLVEIKKNAAWAMNETDPRRILPRSVVYAAPPADAPIPMASTVTPEDLADHVVTFFQQVGRKADDRLRKDLVVMFGAMKPLQLATADARLDFSTLRDANVRRQAEWCTNGVMPDLSYRSNELAGETGEACNEVKKLERERLGWPGSRTTIEKLGKELGDVVISADLLASAAGINLAEYVTRSFNEKSAEMGHATFLPAIDRAMGAKDGQS